MKNGAKLGSVWFSSLLCNLRKDTNEFREFAILANNSVWVMAVLRIWIRRIRMFMGLLDLDPLVRGMDPEPDPVLQSSS